MRNIDNQILKLKSLEWLTKIYGYKEAENILLFVSQFKLKAIRKSKMTNKDIFVITYANNVITKIPNLGNVTNVLEKYYPKINSIHFLPFFVWTSDDGFSVSNYTKIDTRYGKWSDLLTVKHKYNMMFDFVINHSSKKNIWFKKFLKNDPEYSDFYIEKAQSFDYSKIIRPRTLPLFHEYEGRKIWSTFSEDQVDLNFRSSSVFKKIIKIIAFYVSKGMTAIRLDAVGFLWKESGDSGMHHKNTHLLIKSIKDICNYLFGEITIISEVNVPHDENMKYLGYNGDESDEVYNFALPPLMAFTLIKGNAKKIMKWMKFFEKLNTNETMFNFLSSHDGVGIRSVESILSESEINLLIQKVKDTNGKINYKKNTDGTTSVYELNTTYTDLIFSEGETKSNYAKYLLAHSLLILLKGTPAIYFNSLFVRHNWIEGIRKTSNNRSINRRLYTEEELNIIAKDKNVLKVMEGINKVMELRCKYPQFGPYTSQKNIDGLSEKIIAFKRANDIFVYANISNKPVDIQHKGENFEISSLTIKVFKNNESIF